MSTQDIEAIRGQIWDQIYVDGIQSVDALAEQLGVPVSEVMTIVDCDWFVVQEDNVYIATRG